MSLDDFKEFVEWCEQRIFDQTHNDVETTIAFKATNRTRVVVQVAELQPANDLIPSTIAYPEIVATSTASTGGLQKTVTITINETQGLTIEGLNVGVSDLLTRIRNRVALHLTWYGYFRYPVGILSILSCFVLGYAQNDARGLTGLFTALSLALLICASFAYMIIPARFVVVIREPTLKIPWDRIGTLSAVLAAIAVAVFAGLTWYSTFIVKHH